MDEQTILGWIKVGELAINIGVATADTLRTLFKAGGVTDDDAVLDRIVTEAALRKARRDAVPDSPQG